MFVTINHPSEVNEKRCQSQIRSFTAKEREKKKKRLRAANNHSQATAKCPDHRIVSPISIPHYKPPSPSASNASSIRDLAIPPTLRLKLCTNAIDATRFSQVLNFYIEHLGPNALWSRMYCPGCSSDKFKNYALQMIMTDPLVTEATLAFSFMYLESSATDSPLGILINGHSQAVLQHRGNFLRILLARMKTAPNEMVSDTTLLAILTMLILESTISDWPAYAANWAGIRQLLARRGGVASLKWQCSFRTHLTWADLRVAAHTAAQKSTSADANGLKPFYPTLPYSSDLRLTISKLPIGLMEAVLSGALSTKLMDFFVAAYEWTKQFDPEAAECAQAKEYYAKGLKLISALAYILVKYTLSPTEWILCVGLYAYINSTDGRKKTYRQPRGLDDILTSIESVSSRTEIDNSLLWAAMAIATNNDNVSPTAKTRWCLLDKYLDRAQAVNDWEDVKSLMERFWWTTALEDHWRECWQTVLHRRMHTQIHFPLDIRLLTTAG